MTNNPEHLSSEVVTELLPCPFCGGEDVTEYHKNSPRNHAVQCDDCEGMAPFNRWNTRPLTASRPVDGLLEGEAAQCPTCESKSRAQYGGWAVECSDPYHRSVCGDGMGEQVKRVAREPTEAMLDASWHMAGESKEMRPRTHAHYRRHWIAMYDAAIEAYHPTGEDFDADPDDPEDDPSDIPAEGAKQSPTPGSSPTINREVERLTHEELADGFERRAIALLGRGNSPIVGDVGLGILIEEAAHIADCFTIATALRASLAHNKEGTERHEQG